MHTMSKTTLLAFFALVPLLAFGAHHKHAEKKDRHEAGKMEKMMASRATKGAVAIIRPTADNAARGHVRFTKTGDGILVEGRIEGLSPGPHGFHVHQFGDLRAGDGTSAGGHFNPKGKPHGGPDDRKRHVGDLGNIEADEEGVAEFSFTDPKLSFRGRTSIIGRGLIVHAGEDDLSSQPTGAAGPRVGMGVIGVANPEL